MTIEQIKDKVACDLGCISFEEILRYFKEDVISAKFFNDYFDLCITLYKKQF